jgi:homoserine O-succinyltransferase
MHLRIALIDLYTTAGSHGIRCLKQLLEAQALRLSPGVNLSWKCFALRSEKALPKLEEYDVLLCSGGPGNPVGGEGAEGWEEAFHQLLESIQKPPFSSSKFGFAICHSFQMLASRKNLGQIGLRDQPSFGVVRVIKTAQAQSDPVMGYLPQPFYATDSRSWQVLPPSGWQADQSLPGGACVLAIERFQEGKKAALMAIRFAANLWGTQFHPEADLEWMESSLNSPEKKAQVMSVEGPEGYQEMLHHLTDPSHHLLTRQLVLPAFLDHVISLLNPIKAC